MSATLDKQVITIKDVASFAGVSIATVSRVLNGLDRVSAKTRQKVEAAIRELNYVPNNIAQSMITKRTNMIAVVIPELVNDFYINVILGIERVTNEQGYHVMIFSYDNLQENEINMASSAFEKMADGVIVVPSVKSLDIYNYFGKKIILVDRYLPSVKATAVVVDNFGGSVMMTNYLIQKGHHKIAIINGNEDFPVGQERKAGYISSLLNHNIPIRKEYIIVDDWYERCGYEGVKTLMALPDPPTAIYCTNNLICTGALRYMCDHNIKIGQDISLSGFDDYPLAAYVNPGITVIDRPTVDMGKCAANYLLSIIAGKKQAGISAVTTLGVRLLERNSVKDLN